MVKLAKTPLMGSVGNPALFSALLLRLVHRLLELLLDLLLLHPLLLHQH